MSQIVVKNGAPGWPAMVKTAPKQNAIKPVIDPKKAALIRNMKNSCSSEASPSRMQPQSTPETAPTNNPVTMSSMWLKRRYADQSNVGEIKKGPAFAPKIVRQCNSCQMLYTNFHTCEVDLNAGVSYSQKGPSHQK